MKIVHASLALLLADCAFAVPLSKPAPVVGHSTSHPFQIEYAGPDNTLPTRLSRPSIEPGKHHELRIDYAPVAGKQRPVMITESGYSHGKHIRRQIKLIHDAKGKLSGIDGPLPGTDDGLSVKAKQKKPQTAQHSTDTKKPKTSNTESTSALIIQNAIGAKLNPQHMPWLQTALIIGAEHWPANLQQLATPATTSPAKPSNAGSTILQDDFGRITLLQSADIGKNEYFHDLADQLIEARDGSGGHIRIDLDPYGRPLSRHLTDADGFNESTHYRYEGKNLRQVSSPSFTESYQYDEKNRLVERVAIVHPAGSQQSQRFQTRFRYHQDVRKPMSITLPNGAEIGFWRKKDKVEFIDALNFKLGERHPGNLITIELAGKNSLGGEELLFHHANGLYTQAWFDDKRQLHAQQVMAFADIMSSQNIVYRFRLRYGPDGRVSAHETGAVPLTYQHDTAGRLTDAVWDFEQFAADGPLFSWHYGWDQQGNRLSQSFKTRRDKPVQTQHNVVTGAHRYTGVPYDTSGRPRQWQNWQISWHPANLIRQMTHPDGRQIRYYYNHRGERIARQQGTEWRFYDYQDGLLQAEVGTHRPLMRTWWYRGKIPLLVLDQHEDNPAQTLGDDEAKDSRTTATTTSAATDTDTAKLACTIDKGDSDTKPSPQTATEDSTTGSRQREYKVRWVHVDQRGLPLATTTPAAYVNWGMIHAPFGEAFGNLNLQSAWPRMVKHESLAKQYQEDPLIR
ncbi:MAG: hypothetical protein Q4D91_09955 [Lautropia sp.]|nr:hypothetical protein [Lautropia sp.]